MGDLRKKNIPQTDFDKKKILQGNNFGKKYPALKKISRMADNAGKKSYTVECWGKNSFSRVLEKKILTQTKSHIHPIKSQKDDP